MELVALLERGPAVLSARPTPDLKLGQLVVEMDRVTLRELADPSEFPIRDIGPLGTTDVLWSGSNFAVTRTVFRFPMSQ